MPVHRGSARPHLTTSNCSQPTRLNSTLLFSGCLHLGHRHDLSSSGGVCLQHPPTSPESRLLRKASGTSSRHTARACLATQQRSALDYPSYRDHTLAPANVGCMTVLPRRAASLASESGPAAWESPAWSGASGRRPNFRVSYWTDDIRRSKHPGPSTSHPLGRPLLGCLTLGGYARFLLLALCPLKVDLAYVQRSRALVLDATSLQARAA